LKFALLLSLTLTLTLVAFYSFKPVEASSTSKGPVKILRISPYICNIDTCQGYRCIGDIALEQGTSVSPACYNVNELESRNCRNGEYKLIPEFSKVCTDNEYFYVWTR
jgi:hypothetical protein